MNAAQPTSGPTGLPGILAGLRIVEGSAFVAAPLGGMTLAQLGAEVIRFDPIQGGLDYRRWPVTEAGQSVYWTGLNKGKKSIRIDIASPAGRALVHRLLAAPGEGGGLFLTNFPPRGWLDFEALKAASREDLIMVNLLGSPDGGSAVDYTVNPAVGFPDVTGPDHAVINHVMPCWDAITGLTLSTGLLAAERHRRLTGAGQYLSVALSDVAMAMVGHLGHIAEVEVLDQPRQPLGNDLFGAFGRDFPTSDGRRIMLVAITRGQWKKLLEATGTGEAMAEIAARTGLDLGDEGQRFAAREEIAGVLAPWVAARTLARCAEALDGAGALWAPYRSFAQMLEEDWRASPENPMFSRVMQPGIGAYLMPGSPIRFADATNLPPAPAPILGQHTDEILGDLLGLPDHEIGQLHDAGTVAGPMAG